jgi:probable HAF family extracellular repeat protein
VISRFVGVTASAVLCCGASAQVYQFTDLGVLQGGSYCIPKAMNDRGDVVGIADRPNLGQRAFLWRDGEMSDIGSLGGTPAAAGGINNTGLVAGWSRTEAGPYHLFVYDIDAGSIADAGMIGVRIQTVAINDGGALAGTYRPRSYGGATNAFHAPPGQAPQDIGTFDGGTNAAANGINNAGVLVGWSTGGPSGLAAFTYVDGTFTPLGVPPGYTITQGVGINEAGHVAVTATNQEGASRAFLFDGEWHDCGALPGQPAGAASYATAINDDDAILGSATFNGEDHAFLWTASSGMIDLNSYARGGWRLTDAITANAAGQIAGRALVGSQTRGFLLTRCMADFNGDGTVTSQDIFDFLVAFFDGAPRADSHHDGNIDSQDLFDFLGAFFAGC